MTPRSLYGRQLALSVATVVVAAAGLGLANLASTTESDLVGMSAIGIGLLAVAWLLVEAIRHAAGVARYTFDRSGPGFRGEDKHF